jgi:hypothetical protein
MTRALEEARAWQLYRAQLRNLTGDRYYAIEPWAWSVLQQRLAQIHQRRERVAA